MNAAASTGTDVEMLESARLTGLELEEPESELLVRAAKPWQEW